MIGKPMEPRSVERCRQHLFWEKRIEVRNRHGQCVIAQNERRGDCFGKHAQVPLLGETLVEHVGGCLRAEGKTLNPLVLHLVDHERGCEMVREPDIADRRPPLEI